MLNKFKDNGGISPLQPEAEKFMVGWAEVVGIISVDRMKTLQIIGRVSAQRFSDPSVNFVIESESALNEEMPELVVAMNGLRNAVDNLSGWGIEWRHMVRGDIIGFETTQTENALMQETMRSPYEFHLSDGFVLGGKVGPDSLLSGIGIWLEIGDKPGGRGAHYLVDEMFEIDLTPPKA